ncbi:hypothetical protein DsansV1_C31g0216651 [Dioscorea sansibarensis]
MPSFASLSDIIWRCGQGALICWDFGAFSGYYPVDPLKLKEP